MKQHILILISEFANVRMQQKQQSADDNERT